MGRGMNRTSVLDAGLGPGPDDVVTGWPEEPRDLPVAVDSDALRIITWERLSSWGLWVPADRRRVVYLAAQWEELPMPQGVEFLAFPPSTAVPPSPLPAARGLSLQIWGSGQATSPKNVTHEVDVLDVFRSDPLVAEAGVAMLWRVVGGGRLRLALTAAREP